MPPLACMQAELASSARALALERGEAAAARETAQQATQALHAALRSHQAEVERLQEHIKLLTVSGRRGALWQSCLLLQARRASCCDQRCKHLLPAYLQLHVIHMAARPTLQAAHLGT
jgi:hypothetical protein